MINGARRATVHTHRYAAHGHTILELHGDIDIATAARVSPQIHAATNRPEPAIVIDLTHTTFFDCSGLRLLCQAHRCATARHGHVHLVCPHPFTLRLLKAADLTRYLHPAPTLDDALAQHATTP